MNGSHALSLNEVQYITDENVKSILTAYGHAINDTIIEKYTVNFASDKMLGFQADYLKLQISVNTKKGSKLLRFFVKVISKTNAAKASMVQEMGLFEKEFNFFEVIKPNIDIADLKPWSAKFVTRLGDAIIFEDLSTMGYRVRNKYDKFDAKHTLQALKTLARFHAATFITEEKKTKDLQHPYRIQNEYSQYMSNGGYNKTEPWFYQCTIGALEALKSFSKYKHNEKVIKTIEEKWCDVFNSALELSVASSEHRNVICHRDLWNNNILFHYSSLEPDDCVLVDFQAIHCQPPAGDVMLLLHCNLDPQYRKDNLSTFLNFYYDELKAILWRHNIDVEVISTRDKFMTSAEELNLLGLVTHACLVPVFWLSDDLTIKIFGDSSQFYDIMNKDKTTFINTMMQNNHDYRKVVMEVFEEIAEQYCINAK